MSVCVRAYEWLGWRGGERGMGLGLCKSVRLIT